MELRIDLEFRDKIPPLTQEEFDQLRDNILEDGEIYEPISVWNGVIVDGHNRWKIYLEHPELPEPKIAEKQFVDKYEAFEWMYRKQLGRRNLTEAQRAYMIGKMYEARKRSQGGTGANQHTTKNEQTGQNVRSATRREIKDGTAGQIGRDFGINGKTVRRYANYAESVDAIREVSPDAAQKILSGEPGVPAATVTRYTILPPDEKEQFVADVIAGNRPKAVSGNPAGFNQEMRKLHAEINAIANDMCDPDSTPEYSLSDLTAEITENGEAYIRQLTRTLNDRKELYAGNSEAQDEVSEAITTVIIEKINNLMEGVINA